LEYITLEEENTLEMYAILLLGQFYKLRFSHKSYVRNCLFTNTKDIILRLFYKIFIVIADSEAFEHKISQ